MNLLELDGLMEDINKDINNNKKSTKEEDKDKDNAEKRRRDILEMEMKRQREYAEYAVEKRRREVLEMEEERQRAECAAFDLFDEMYASHQTEEERQEEERQEEERQEEERQEEERQREFAVVVEKRIADLRMYAAFDLFDEMYASH